MSPVRVLRAFGEAFWPVPYPELQSFREDKDKLTQDARAGIEQTLRQYALSDPQVQDLADLCSRHPELLQPALQHIQAQTERRRQSEELMLERCIRSRKRAQYLSFACCLLAVCATVLCAAAGLESLAMVISGSLGALILVSAVIGRTGKPGHRQHTSSAGTDLT